MRRVEKNALYNSDQFEISVNHQNFEHKNFNLYEIFFQHRQHSHKIFFLLFNNKDKFYIKHYFQNNVPDNNQQ